MEIVGGMLVTAALAAFLLLVVSSSIACRRAERRADAHRRALAAMSTEELTVEARRIAVAHGAHEAATHALLDDDIRTDAELLVHLDALEREYHALHVAGESGLCAIRDVVRCRLRRAAH